MSSTTLFIRETLCRTALGGEVLLGSKHFFSAPGDSYGRRLSA